MFKIVERNWLMNFRGTVYRFDKTNDYKRMKQNNDGKCLFLITQRTTVGNVKINHNIFFECGLFPLNHFCSTFVYFLRLCIALSVNVFATFLVAFIVIKDRLPPIKNMWKRRMFDIFRVSKVLRRGDSLLHTHYDKYEVQMN